jgi:hypothetical protein
MQIEVNGQVFDTDAALITLDDGRIIEFGPDVIVAYSPDTNPSDGSVTETNSLFEDE